MTAPEHAAARIVPVDDADRTGALIADAFAVLRVAQWLIADPVQRRRLLAAQFSLLAGHVQAHGHVDAAVDANGGWLGVAVWADRTGSAPQGPADYDERLADLAGAHLDRLRILDAAFDAHHPRDLPHQHLMFLAVDPRAHGRGIGTRLLEHGLARADDARVPVYLEASSRRTRDWYRRYGFTARPVLALPGGPDLYPMLRPVL